MEKCRKRKGRVRGRERNSEKETGVKERLLIMLTTRPKLTALPNIHSHKHRVTERQAYMNTHTHTGLHRHNPLTHLLHLLFTIAVSSDIKSVDIVES